MFATLLATLFLVLPQDPPPPPATDPAGFRAISLSAAREAAALEKRPILLAFVDPTSEAGRSMDEVTWKDPTIRRWLDARVVALRVDSRTEPELAQRYSVTEGSVVVLCAASGDEAQRWNGVVPPRELMPKLQPLLPVAEPIAVARKAVLENPGSADARARLGDVFLDCRLPALAFESFLWAWDHGAAEPGFAGDRRISVAMRLGELAKRGKELRGELVARRDATRERLMRFAEGDDSVALATDVATLHAALAAPEKQFEVWTALRARPNTPAAVLSVSFSDSLAQYLHRERRFAEFIEGRGDMLASFDAAYGRLLIDLRAAEKERTVPPADALPKAGIDPLEVRRSTLLHSAGMCVEALCATGSVASARELAELVLSFDGRPASYASLCGAAARGGSAELQAQLLEFGRKSLTDPEARAQLESLIESAKRTRGR